MTRGEMSLGARRLKTIAKRRAIAEAALAKQLKKPHKHEGRQKQIVQTFERRLALLAAEEIVIKEEMKGD